jgi:hypothetical protein
MKPSTHEQNLAAKAELEKVGRPLPFDSHDDLAYAPELGRDPHPEEYEREYLAWGPGMGLHVANVDGVHRYYRKIEKEGE